MAEILENNLFEKALDVYLGLAGTMAYESQVKGKEPTPLENQTLKEALKALQAFSPPEDLLAITVQRRLDSAIPGPNPVARNNRNLLAGKSRKALIAWYEENQVN